jgi:hypothetical protein
MHRECTHNMKCLKIFVPSQRGLNIGVFFHFYRYIVAMEL